MNNAFSRRKFLKDTPLLVAGLAGVAQVRAAAPEAPINQPFFNVRQFGANGDGQTKDTAAVQKAIDSAGRQGGCVYFPPGRYLCGTVRLQSHVSIQLENGATL